VNPAAWLALTVAAVLIAMPVGLWLSVMSVPSRPEETRVAFLLSMLNGMDARFRQLVFHGIAEAYCTCCGWQKPGHHPTCAHATVARPPDQVIAPD